MCECNEEPCYCKEGWGECESCGKRTSYHAEWDDSLWICFACGSCESCFGRTTIECAPCCGGGMMDNGEHPGGPDHHDWECPECEGEGRVACPKCQSDSRHGSLAREADYAAESRVDRQRAEREAYLEHGC